MRTAISVFMVAIFLLNFVFAQSNDSSGTYLNQSIQEARKTLFYKDSPICKLMGILNVVGAVAMTSGVILAGYNFLSTSQEAREKGKLGTEGILIGGGLIGLAPQIVSYIFGFAIC